MSLHTDLEIYKAADQLLALALDVQANIQRQYRVAIGQRITDACAYILITVARANAARDAARARHIEDLLEHLEVAKVFLRAGFNKKCIGKEVWANSIELTDIVGKQANGWRSATLGTGKFGFSAASAA